MTRQAAAIKGQSAVWGIESEMQTLQSGIVRSVTRKKTGEKDYLYDYEGFTITQIFFDDREEVELEVVCKSDTVAPTNGATLAIGSVSFLVQDSDLAWEQRGWKKLRTRATYFPNLTLGA